MGNNDLQKRVGPMVVLALLENRPRHGYEIGKLIAQKSGDSIQVHIASLYPILYQLEEEGLIKGRWRERAGERRKRFYTVTDAGRRALERERREWRGYIKALDAIVGLDHG